MDDRNLVAVAEQAAATARVVRGTREGATAKFEDGRVFRGCRVEFADPALDVDAITAALSAGRVEGARRVVRVGLYSPSESELPAVPTAALLRLRELAAPGLVVIRSGGSGEHQARSLQALLAEAGLPGPAGA